ncbi:MAG: PorP/SprF family type IX secretion system membrane protein, partial [Bacteroidales bacterium]
QMSLLTAEMPIDFIKGGLGLSVQSAKAGYLTDTKIGLAYAYHLETSVGRLGLGVQLDLRDIAIDFSKLNPITGSDPVLTGKQKEDAFYVDFGVGAYFNSYSNFFVGLAFNNIATGKKDLLHYRTSRELVINGGYNFSFDALPAFEFTPTTIVRTDFTSIDWNIAAMFTYNKKIWGGISYTIADAVTILAGVNIKQFRIGVSYDINATNATFKSAPGGSLEISLKYCFKLDADKVNTNYKNSRYL